MLDRKIQVVCRAQARDLLGNTPVTLIINLACIPVHSPSRIRRLFSLGRLQSAYNDVQLGLMRFVWLTHVLLA